jgi:hypothetical protein
MRKFLIVAAVVMAMPGLAAAEQSAPAPAAQQAASGYSTSATDIGTLLDDPTAKAVLVKLIPDMVNNDQIDMARTMTLRDIQQYAPDALTDETLATLDAELAKISAKK